VCVCVCVLFFSEFILSLYSYENTPIILFSCKDDKSYSTSFNSLFDSLEFWTTHEDTIFFNFFKDSTNLNLVVFLDEGLYPTHSYFTILMYFSYFTQFGLFVGLEPNYLHDS
jgi:hypothetical protein